VKPIVIDASMAISWLMEDERTPAGDNILAELTTLTPISTPLLWHEVRNILVHNEKREDASDTLICTLAFQYKLTAYDAAYLALALETRAILATNDRQLARAALAVNLELRTLLDTPL